MGLGKRIIISCGIIILIFLIYVSITMPTMPPKYIITCKVVPYMNWSNITINLYNDKNESMSLWQER